MQVFYHLFFKILYIILLIRAISDFMVSLDGALNEQGNRLFSVAGLAKASQSSLLPW
jgi:hypothetical protein